MGKTRHAVPKPSRVPRVLPLPPAPTHPPESGGDAGHWDTHPGASGFLLQIPTCGPRSPLPSRRLTSRPHQAGTGAGKKAPTDTAPHVPVPPRPGCSSFQCLTNPKLRERSLPSLSRGKEPTLLSRCESRLLTQPPPTHPQDHPVEELGFRTCQSQDVPALLPRGQASPLGCSYPTTPGVHLLYRVLVCSLSVAGGPWQCPPQRLSVLSQGASGLSGWGPQFCSQNLPTQPGCWPHIWHSGRVPSPDHRP